MHTYCRAPCSDCGDMDGCHIPAKVKRLRNAAWHGLDYPKIVCLCGSTRFTDAFREANLRETVEGNIVLTVGCDTKSDAALGLGPDLKNVLDELHKRKIELADEVLILNVGGYIGESTRRELEHARRLDKVVRFLEPEATDAGKA